MYDDDEGPLMGDYRSQDLINSPPPSYESAMGIERFSSEPVARDTVWAVLFWVQFAGKRISVG
jgi:hypothetical protein